MKFNIQFLVIIFAFNTCFAQLPDGFVYVNDIVPDLDVELRYFTTNNFIGKPINGYKSNTLILTRDTANALKKVQAYLQTKNLCLKVFDGYRPQTAVNHFVKWARDLNDTLNKKQFYPSVKKRYLFNEGYIASKSGHSRGSTVDVTIIDGTTGIPLDMGSHFDFFGKKSWVNYSNITPKQKANRQLLQEVMAKFGFRGYSKEWWHFTLRHEPFPKTYFSFPVE